LNSDTWFMGMYVRIYKNIMRAIFLRGKRTQSLRKASLIYNLN
jgi:hypothetical protein